MGVYLIVCPLLFLAGFVDAIGGGGGLISLPAYLFAGLPIHHAIATNKLSSACGTSLTTIRFIRNGLVSVRLAVPSVIAAMIGSFCGARLSLMMSENVMRLVLLIALPAASFCVLNPHLFPDRSDQALILTKRTYATAVIAAFVIGAYDGFYGPGTGTFLIIALTWNHRDAGRFPAQRSGAHTAWACRRSMQHAWQLHRIGPCVDERDKNRPSDHSDRVGTSLHQNTVWFVKSR